MRFGQVLTRCFLRVRQGYGTASNRNPSTPISQPELHNVPHGFEDRRVARNFQVRLMAEVIDANNRTWKADPTPNSDFFGVQGK